MQPQHVYVESPKYCIAFKPRMILVCVPAGGVRSAYFGPGDGDEQGAQLELFRREVDAAAQILAARSAAVPSLTPPVAA